MIAQIASAGLKVAGSIFGGIKAAKEAKKQQKMLDDQKAQNEAWYNRRYNEDGTQRADAQRLLTQTQDRLRSSNRAAAGTAAVMGGSTEAVAAQKAANNSVLADTVGTIAANADARKDNIEQQYMAKQDNLVQQNINLSQQRQNAITQAVSGVSSAADSLGGSNGIQDKWDKKK